MNEERTKPPFVAGAYDMSHVPPPNPENYWRMEVNEPRVIMVNPDTMEPLLTIVVREVLVHPDRQEPTKVAMQIVANPKLKNWKPL